MQIKNIVAAQTYKTKQGAEKTTWVNCGTLFIKDDGKMSIKFNPFINPCAFKDLNGDVWFRVFDTKKENPKTQENNPAQEELVPF